MNFKSIKCYKKFLKLQFVSFTSENMTITDLHPVTSYFKQAE